MILIYSFGVGFSQVSVNIEKSTFENIAIGETVNTTFEIANTLPVDANFKIYLEDYRQELDQTFYEAPNTTPRSNASWIKIATSEFSVPANSKRNIPIEIAVPNNPELVGSYWSLVMVEPAPVRDPNREGLTIVNRYGVSVITTLVGGYSDFNFENPIFNESESEIPQFTVHATNIGTDIAEANVYLDIFGSDGTELSRIDAGELKFRPDNPRQLTFDFSELPSLDEGVYTALLIVDAGEDNLFGARYSLDFE